MSEKQRVEKLNRILALLLDMSDEDLQKALFIVYSECDLWLDNVESNMEGYRYPLMHFLDKLGILGENWYPFEPKWKKELEEKKE